jgi:iron complex transport system ATP-binding protein
MSDSAVELDSLLVRLGGREILRVPRLAVCRSEVVVVLGPNGAGKSTLLKCILGFTRPTSGELRVLGQRVAPRPAAPLCRLRRRIGYVPQVPAVPGETPLTVREVVAIGRTGIVGLFRRLAPADWDAVDAWIDKLGLGGLAGSAFAGLSGGEQRKVLIAKAMVQEPEILLLDEPTAHLDLFWRERILAALGGLYDETRLTIVLVCHELEAIPPCCRRLLVLRDGRVLADGSPPEVMTPRLVELLYGAQLRLLAAGNRYAAVPVGEALP